jgi:hypothetical protein
MSSSTEQQQQQQVDGNLKSSIRGSFPFLKQREEMLKRQDSRYGDKLNLTLNNLILNSTQFYMEIL